MNNLIGMATGSIHSWKNSLDEQITILKKLNVGCIELTFGTFPELDRKISEENLSYLRNLKYVSMHAPYMKNLSPYYYTTRREIEKVESVYNMIHADTVVFHPNLLRIKLDTFMNICMENLPDFCDVSVEKKHKLVLDTAHALSYGPGKIEELIGKYDIQHVHLSDRRYSEFRKKVRDHQQMLFCQEIHKFEAVRKLSCPILIEISTKDRKNDIANLVNEVEFVRALFSQVVN